MDKKNFDYYYDNRSQTSTEGLSPIDLANIETKRKSLRETQKAALATYLAGVGPQIDDRLAQIELLRVSFARGDQSAMQRIVSARQQIMDLEELGPIIQREIDELFGM